MIWIQIAYLFALLYFSVSRKAPFRMAPLRTAWIWFSLIPISQFVFTLFRAANMRSERDLALIEVWADGVGWLLLGISFLCLTGCVAQGQSSAAEWGPDGKGQ